MKEGFLADIVLAGLADSHSLALSIKRDLPPLLASLLDDARFDHESVTLTFRAFYHQKAFRFIKKYKNLVKYFSKYKCACIFDKNRDYFKWIIYLEEK